MVPVAVKIAPTSTRADRGHRRRAAGPVEAVIATNTTTARDGVAGMAHAAETGGLSGAPLAARSTGVVREITRALQGAIPVIAVGGIMRGADAVEKVAAGASLVQIYTGFIYRGPPLVGECVAAVVPPGICRP